MNILLEIRKYKYRLENYWQFLRYFYFGNLRAIYSRKLAYSKSLKAKQFLFCTGRGKINIGENCVFGFKMGGFHRNGLIELQARNASSIINLGDSIRTNNNLFICAANMVKIGGNTTIGNFVFIIDHEPHGVDPTKRNKVGEIGEVIIGNNCRIATNVQFLKNSGVGENSIVGAGAVVTKMFPDNVIIGGVPAKIIKTL